MARKQNLYTYIVLDRTGSMTDKWQQSISSINEYVNVLKESKEVKSFVKVVAFDDNGVYGHLNKSGSIYLSLDTQTAEKVSTVFEMASIDTWVPLTVESLQLKNVYPRGMTNLYDATGKTLNEAIESGKKRVCVVVVTDGYENASKEFTQETIKAKIKQFQDDGKEVVFLGANFDVSTTASTLGMAQDKFINTVSNNLSGTMRALATHSVAYGSMGATMSISAEDKAAAIKS